MSMPPELILMVLQHLEDDENSLVQAARVNKLWRSFALDVLWTRNRDPDRFSLLRVNPQVRQSLADRIRYLAIPPSRLHEYREVNLPNLRELVIIGIFDNDQYESLAADVERLLQPRLRLLTLEGPLMCGDILAMARRRCPDLRTLTINDSGEPGFLELLLSFERLESLLFGATSSLTPQHLQQLLALDRLRELSLGFFSFQSQDIQRFLAESTAPFLKLTVLNLAADSASVISMLRNTPNLRGLVLDGQDDWARVLPELSIVPDLRALHITFPVSAPLQLPDLIPLHRLPRLQTLVLHCPTPPAITTPPPSYEEELTVFSGFRNMIYMQLTGPISISSAGLIALGLSSRKIKRIEIPGVYDVRRFARYDFPLFPCLEELEVANLVSYSTNVDVSHPEVQASRELLKKHMPRIHTFYHPEDIKSFAAYVLDVEAWVET
ncbi:hypothetical protein K461DRAFT_290443 [Myriangium duriaei CBS 260.36]|uniref:F-box domain-containing protein n=1 Tax=Myriangium duriaei CBS 260.36 TaxID=1168546 RepID=A0A9P4JB20_9PEZI|nr:hypothetical protein K461DRAFT_290443 [Myriangium duriaei CBS 260.36]